jgi:hypothetical protein
LGVEKGLARCEPIQEIVVFHEAVGDPGPGGQGILAEEVFHEEWLVEVAKGWETGVGSGEMGHPTSQGAPFEGSRDFTLGMEPEE